MRVIFPGSAAVAAAIALTPTLHRVPTPESELAEIVRVYLSMSLPADWSSLEKLPSIRWAPLPPTSLQNCLPDGVCFTRQGTATLSGRPLTIVATGARTMVLNLMIRNSGTPIGETAIVGALKAAGLGADLARCPVRGGAGSTNWYRLGGSGISSGFLSVQAARTGRGEGYVLSFGDKLPALQPNQLSLYSEQCAAGVAQAPVSNRRPHEMLADLVTQHLVPAGGPTAYDWAALRGMSSGITWNGSEPRRTDLTTLKNDPNPVSLTGQVTLAGREFAVMASGTPAAVKVIYLDEGGMHPRGEHMLGVVYEKGFAVQLVRCGPVYTESTNNWYSIGSNRTRPAMILQSIRYEGNSVQDGYALRLDGTLPTRDPRDRNPGTSGC